MNKYATLIYHDLKNTRRDPTLLLMLMVPAIMIAVLRLGIPALTTFFPIVADYYTIIVAFFVVMNSMFPAFIIAFILLDEKDLNLFPVIKTTPLSLSGVLYARLIFIISLGFICSWLVLFFNGLINITPIKSLQLIWLSALNAPLLSIVISTLAKNKVEGLTYLKAANVVLFIPMAIWFIDSKWELLLSVFPAFWPFKIIESDHSVIYFSIGSLYLIALNYWCINWAVRKN